jgi:hypothetical protein
MAHHPLPNLEYQENGFAQQIQRTKKSHFDAFLPRPLALCFRGLFLVGGFVLDVFNTRDVFFVLEEVGARSVATRLLLAFRALSSLMRPDRLTPCWKQGSPSGVGLLPIVRRSHGRVSGGGVGNLGGDQGSTVPNLAMKF